MLLCQPLPPTRPAGTGKPSLPPPSSRAGAQRVPEPGAGAGQMPAGRCGCPVLSASSGLGDLDFWELSRASGTRVGLGLES